MIALLSPSCLNFAPPSTAAPPAGVARAPQPAMMGKATMNKRAAAKLKLQKMPAAEDAGTSTKKKATRTKAMKGVVVPIKRPEPEPVAAAPVPESVPAASTTPDEPVWPEPVWRENAWFPKNAAEMAPPIFQQFPELEIFGMRPGGTAPYYLDGSMAGDQGLDPLNLVALADPDLGKDGVYKVDELARSPMKRLAKLESMAPAQLAESVAWMREAELKHGRIAMLAAAGWPLAELATHRRAPSLFNGHLFEFKHYGNALGLLTFLGLLALLEARTGGKGGEGALGEGDYGFDPLGLYAGEAFPLVGVKRSPEELRLSEIKHGRAAMLAITGFSVQEFVSGDPVTKTWPMFFGPAAFGFD